MTARGEVRLTFEGTVWVWLDRELPTDDWPTVGQAIRLLTPGHGALNQIPCQIVQVGRGGSIQVSVSGRVIRVQRRGDVRARVDLPPVSAVRLGPGGHPEGLIGLNVMDLSGGGIRMRGSEPIAAGERLRIILRLDDDEPLTPTVDVLVGGSLARGRFGTMPERDRRRIVQFVYRQELAERQRTGAATPSE